MQRKMSHRTGRPGLALAAALMAALGTSQVAVAHEAKKPKPPDNIVRVWYSLPQRQAAVFEELVGRYAAEHPKLVFQVRHFGSMHELHDELVGSAEQPHLALIDSCWQKELAGKNRLVQAEAQMERVGTMAKIVAKADTFPGMWEAVQLDGRTWTLPAFADVDALLYDAERIQRAGVKKAPKTWDQVLAVAKKCTDPKLKTCGLALPLDEPDELAELFHVERLQWVEKPDAPKPAAGKATKGKPAAAKPAPAPTPAPASAPKADEGPVVEDPELKASAYAGVAQYWLDLAHKHKVLSLEAEKRAEAAMYVGSLDELLVAQGAGRKVEAWPLPTFGKPAAHMKLYTMAIMNVDTNHVERHWETAHWLTEFAQELEMSTRSGVLPANKQVTLSPPYYQFLQGHPGVRCFLAQLPYARPYSHDATFEATLAGLGRRLREGLEHPKPVKDILTEAAATH